MIKRKRVVKPRVKKEITIQTLKPVNSLIVTNTYYLYAMEKGQRLYVGSFAKRFGPKGHLTLYIPKEGWTWKRDAATKFYSEYEAKTFAKMIHWECLKLEKATEISEYIEA